MKRKTFLIKMVQASVLAGLSILLYFLKINWPAIFPSFLEIQFSLVPAIIATLVLGLDWGICVILIRALIKIPFSHTMCVGELADFLIGLSVLTVLWKVRSLYKGKNKELMIFGLSFATWVIVCIFINYFITIPLYAKLMPVSAIVDSCPSFMGVTADNYVGLIVLLGILPFNAFLAALNCTVAALVYRRVGLLFDNMRGERKTAPQHVE